MLISVDVVDVVDDLIGLNFVVVAIDSIVDDNVVVFVIVVDVVKILGSMREVGVWCMGYNSTVDSKSKSFEVPSENKIIFHFFCIIVLNNFFSSVFFQYKLNLNTTWVFSLAM